MSVAGLSVCITGGGTGIGRAAARSFVAAGAQVLIVGDQAEALDETAKELGSACCWRQVDVTERDRIQEVIADMSQLDVLVCCAGVSFQTDLLAGGDDAWRRMIEVNQWGVVHSCAAAGQRMVRQGHGAVVVVTSILGSLGEVGSGAYAMSKAGLDQLVRQMAVEWGPQGVRVNGVAPGPVHTPMSYALGSNELESDWFRQHFLHPERPRIPLGRAGRAEEIAAGILFLADPANSYCTGHVLVLDGGLSIKY